MDKSFFENANQHCVGSLMKTTEKKTIVATEDIVDVNGMKLWARGKAITVSLQERLLAAKLKKPIEMCLQVEDGLKPADLATNVESLLSSIPTIALLAGNGATVLTRRFSQIRLAGLPQLLLTGLSEQDPGAFRHAQVAAIVAGSLAWRMGLDDAQIEAAIVAGLLHDIGELYVDPTLLKCNRELSFDEWRQIAVHPRIGAVLLSEFAKCPAPLVRAVQEHHERLDSSGYPAGTPASSLSELGHILMAAEVLSAVLLNKENPEERALLALRLVRGQFSPKITTLLTTVYADHVAMMPSSFDLGALTDTAHVIAERLGRCSEEAQRLRDDSRLPAQRREVADHAFSLCRILTMSVHSTGVLSAVDHPEQGLQADPRVAAELQVIIPELKWRMRALSRHVALAASRSAGADGAFDALIQNLYVADVQLPASQPAAAAVQSPVAAAA